MRGLRFLREDWPEYIGRDKITGALGTGPDNCFDCTKWGGELEKPDFWIDGF